MSVPVPLSDDFDAAAMRLAAKASKDAAEQDRADVRAAREAWFEGQPDLDPQRQRTNAAHLS